MLTYSLSLVKSAILTSKSIPKRLSIFFLNGRNKDFGEKIPPTAYLNGHPNIAIPNFSLVKYKR
jgi:hypothetical protein